MSKKFLLLFCAALSALPLMAKKSKAKPQEQVKPQTLELVTAEDSASYALGISMGTQVKNNLSKEGYSLDLFHKAFASAMFFSDGLMTKEEADAYLNNYQRRIYEMALDSLKRQQEEFLAQNALAEGVVTTASGLQYRVIKQGDGPRPTATSTVGVNYTGSLITGRVFDTQMDRENPIKLKLNQVIQGWSEGLQLMPQGSKYVLYIPSELGYGDRGAGDVIPPYATLIFEIELISINN